MTHDIERSIQEHGDSEIYPRDAQSVLSSLEEETLPWRQILMKRTLCTMVKSSVASSAVLMDI